MGGGGGGGSSGTGLRFDELHLTAEGLAAKRAFRAIETGEQPACVKDELNGGVVNDRADYLLANTAEMGLGSSPTEQGNSVAFRRCGRVGCTTECVLITDDTNVIVDAALIRDSGHSVCES